MKPQDIIEQLVGKFSSYDQAGDDFTLVVHECSAFNNASCNVDLTGGTVEVLNSDGTQVVKSFAIKAELVPL